jgi:hypothetical protein
MSSITLPLDDLREVDLLALARCFAEGSRVRPDEDPLALCFDDGVRQLLAEVERRGVAQRAEKLANDEIIDSLEESLDDPVGDWLRFGDNLDRPRPPDQGQKC